MNKDTVNSFREMKQDCFQAITLRSTYTTLWTVAWQDSLSRRFSLEEYWNGLPCSSPGNLPDPGIKLASPKSPALASGFFTSSTTLEALNQHMCVCLLITSVMPDSLQPFELYSARFLQYKIKIKVKKYSKIHDAFSLAAIEI